MTFQKIYSAFSKHELLNVLINEKDYQPEAVEAAKQIAKEKNWYADLEQQIITQHAKKEKEYQSEIQEKADYYKKAVEFQGQHNSFQVRISDVAKLEGALAEEGIDFFKEDKNVGVQLDSYPTQTYYFKNEDLDRVDALTKRIGLRAATYVDPQPFFRFEIKVVLIVVFVALIVIALLL